MNLDEDMGTQAKDMIHTLPERWILTRLGQVSEDMAKAMDEYRFNDAANLCYQFVWHEFCDWYLEMAKPGLYGEDEALKRSSRFVLQEALTAVLRLLHPFMPFATEEIWQRLPASRESIMVSKFPQVSDFVHDPQALKEMDLVIGIITGVRNIRGEMNIGPAKRVNVLIEIPDEGEAKIIRQNMIHIQNLAKVESVSVQSKVSKPEASATALFGQNQVHVLLKGLLDFSEERKRLRKEIKKIEKDMESSEKKLSKKDFVEKAPPEIVAQVRTKAETMRLKLDKLNQNLDFFESIKE